MKAITLIQPWATLVAIDAKRIETRSWSTSLRGPLAIHAAQKFPVRAREMAMGLAPEDLSRFARELGVDVLSEQVLPRGAVMAIARLSEIISTDDPAFEPPETGEFEYGNYGPGRYAWYLTDVEPLVDPIPARGSLGLWEWRRGA